jgi:hypothetical protein
MDDRHGRSDQWRLSKLAAGVSELTGSAAAASATGAELLNSERIERQFGSYGIEVLESSAAIRVSNLYSFGNGGRVCRTFAVVIYSDTIDPAVAEEHRMISAGGSIGATFACRNWNVLKCHRHFGTTRATANVAGLMVIAADTPLAVHVYALDAAKAGAATRYAHIVEIHHPDYLDVNRLLSIYGTAPASDPDPWTAAALQAAIARMR